jgi:hypothetical protein
MPSPSLHHCAKRITPKSLEFVMELFAQLNCKKSYWEKGARWAMVEQEGKNMIIQFIETDQKPQKTEMKKNSHIAFLSDNPQETIANLKTEIESKGVKFKQGSWSDKEFYFDCPEIFIDFVIEIMHTSIVK